MTTYTEAHTARIRLYARRGSTAEVHVHESGIVQIHEDVLNAFLTDAGFTEVTPAVGLAPDAPCNAELYSTSHYRPEQIDPRWLHCDLTGPHDVHENSETGATWRTDGGTA